MTVIDHKCESGGGHLYGLINIANQSFSRPLIYIRYYNGLGYMKKYII